MDILSLKDEIVQVIFKIINQKFVFLNELKIIKVISVHKCGLKSE